MPSPSSKQPFSWDDYEHGRLSGHGSEVSLGTRVQFDEPSPSGTSGRLNIPPRNINGPSHGDLHGLQDLRHRRCVTKRDYTQGLPY